MPSEPGPKLPHDLHPMELEMSWHKILKPNFSNGLIPDWNDHSSDMNLITLKKGSLVSINFDFLGSYESIDFSLSDTETPHTSSHKSNHSFEYNEHTWQASLVQ